MRSGNQRFPVRETRTWFVVANRSLARFFETEGGIKGWRALQEIPHPEGKLKNREIETDRKGASMVHGGANSPVHGGGDKGEAAFHVMQEFARSIAKVIENGRVHNAYDRLVLVAPPRFLGELKNSLSPKAEGLVYRTLDQELTRLDDAALRQRLQPVLFD